MLVWTVSNQKGGVGKTPTAMTLAGLAATEGERVLLVDMDPHGSLSAWFRRDPDATGESVYSLFSLPHITREKVRASIIDTPWQHIDLMPASTLLATLERRALGAGRGLVLSRALSCVSADYDLVIFDCPPQLGVLMVNALAACDRLIIPVQTEFLAIKGLERILRTVLMMGQSLNKTLRYLIVPTMFDRRTHASIGSLRTIRFEYGERVWPGIIRIDTRLRDASKAGVPPNWFDPESRAVQDYQSLYRFLHKADVQETKARGAV